MQYADLGSLGELHSTESTFTINPKVHEKIIQNIENRISPVVIETDDPEKPTVRKLDDGIFFGVECLSMHERVAKYIFY